MPNSRSSLAPAFYSLGEGTPESRESVCECVCGAHAHTCAHMDAYKHMTT